MTIGNVVTTVVKEIISIFQYPSAVETRCGKRRISIDVYAYALVMGNDIPVTIATTVSPVSEPVEATIRYLVPIEHGRRITNPSAIVALGDYVVLKERTARLKHINAVNTKGAVANDIVPEDRLPPL
jgi:hypothetical protein